MEKKACRPFLQVTHEPHPTRYNGAELLETGRFPEKGGVFSRSTGMKQARRISSLCEKLCFTAAEWKLWHLGNLAVGFGKQVVVFG